MSPREYKLIFTGSMGAGKTTAIAAVSEIEPCSTDVANNDSGGHAKATTTAALDYGEITLTGGDKLRLYGTPGQSRFDFMWKILGQGSLGVIILIDNSRPDPLRDLRDYAQAFGDALAESRAVVGIGRWQTHPSPSIEEFHEAVRDLAMIGLDRIAGYFNSDVLEGWVATGREPGSVPQVSVAELAAQLRSGGVTVIDVRGRAEWEAGHLPGVATIPVGYLTDRIAEIPRDRPVVMQCQSGARSAIAASVLRATGLTNVATLSGGFADWARAELPVVRESAPDE